MKQLISLFVLTMLTLASYGQKSPDFSIIDSEGKAHSLYADYLDKGQIVVLKLFFITCPLCKPYNESIQALYEEMGSGNEGVEFFLLSNKTWDSNAEVAEYKETYGLTFPGSGFDGGGYDATEPYRAGYFGPFYGTPTFVVISPNGTTYHGIEGDGVMGTMDAIRNKINEVKSNPNADDPITVNVNAKFYKEEINPEYNVYLRSGENHQDKYLVPTSFEYTTDNFPALISPELVLEINETSRENISTLDLVFIQRALLGSTTFDRFQTYASDVNGSGSITAADLLHLGKFILNLIPNFATGKSYLALDSRCATDPSKCLEVIPINPSDGNINAEFTIIQYGDVK